MRRLRAVLRERKERRRQRKWSRVFALLNQAPPDEITYMISAYVEQLETAPTISSCMCTWMMHPDDRGKPLSQQKRLRTTENARCPVHTKVGFIIGFLNFTCTHTRG